jgi:hypothetical protein
MRPDAAGDTRTRVRALLATEEAGGSRPTDTQVAVVGSKPRRAQELLRELRAEQQRIGGELRTAQQQLAAVDATLDSSARSWDRHAVRRRLRADLAVVAPTGFEPALPP